MITRRHKINRTLLINYYDDDNSDSWKKIFTQLKFLRNNNLLSHQFNKQHAVYLFICLWYCQFFINILKLTVI